MNFCTSLLFCIKERKTLSGYIGYVCILVLPLSLGTDIRSNKSDFSTNLHTHTNRNTTEGVSTCQKTFYSYLQTREVLGSTDFKRCTWGGLLWRVLPSFICDTGCCIVCPEMYFCTNRQFIMAHQYYFSFDMITRLQPDTSLLSRVADVLFIYLVLLWFSFVFLCSTFLSIPLYYKINSFIK